MQREMYKLNIAESISSRLGFRSSAAEFFKLIETVPCNGVEIDFKDTKFISRSFAHEYLQRKNAATKEIEEKNVPQNIKQMFQIVVNSKEKHKIHREIQETITLN